MRGGGWGPASPRRLGRIDKCLTFLPSLVYHTHQTCRGGAKFRANFAMSDSKLIHSPSGSADRTRARCAVRMMCALGAIGAWLATSTAAEAGVVCGSAIRRAAMGAAVPSSQQRPASPRECHRRHESLLYGSAMNHAGGASSPSSTHGPNVWPAAALDEQTGESRQNLVSRLALSNRAVLPHPLEDRLFRPPRFDVV